MDKHVVRVDDLQLVGDRDATLDRRHRVARTTSASRCAPTAMRTSASCRASCAMSAAPGRADADRRDRRPDVRAGLHRQRRHHRRPPASLLAAELARRASTGPIRFDSRGIRLDDITATMGGGRVQFGGRVGLDGYLPGDLNVTVRGEDMHLRYPEGIRSTVDADLSLRGNVQAPTLGGVVRVSRRSGTAARPERRPPRLRQPAPNGNRRGAGSCCQPPSRCGSTSK